MNFEQLLGRQLKDDEIIELLEHHEIQVIYDFDRSHEGMEDVYWASAKGAGFQLRFNQEQKLDAVFLYLQSRDEFNVIERDEITFPLYETFDEAKSTFEASGIPHTTSSGEPGTKGYKWWIKADLGASTRHYQFKNGSLSMVTLSLK